MIAVGAPSVRTLTTTGPREPLAAEVKVAIAAQEAEPSAPQNVAAGPEVVMKAALLFSGRPVFTRGRTCIETVKEPLADPAIAGVARLRRRSALAVRRSLMTLPSSAEDGPDPGPRKTAAYTVS